MIFLIFGLFPIFGTFFNLHAFLITKCTLNTENFDNIEVINDLDKKWHRRVPSQIVKHSGNSFEQKSKFALLKKGFLKKKNCRLFGQF